MLDDSDLDSMHLRKSKPRTTKRYAPRVLDEEALARVYAESAEEDSELAEFGMADYAEGLRREDV